MGLANSGPPILSSQLPVATLHSVPTSTNDRRGAAHRIAWIPFGLL